MNCSSNLAHQSDRDAVLDRGIRWKNLVFRKDGTTSYGQKTWPDAQSAKKVADTCEMEMRALYSKGQLARIITADGVVYSDDYSHTMQVPYP